MSSWAKWALAGTGALYYFGDEELRGQMRRDANAAVGMAGRGLQAAFDWATAPTPTASTSTARQASSQASSGALDTYKYTEFRSTLRKPIRLLSFARDSEYGYSCSIEIFELDTAPPFQALSYTWGNPVEFPHLEGGSKQDWKAAYAKEHSFKVDGATLTVVPGRNLDEAFKELWDNKFLMEHKYIWVDAICINQKDKDEKPKQMLIMGDIYRKAAQVIAWLGVELSTTYNGIRALQELERIPQAKWAQMQTMDLTQDTTYAQLGISPIDETDRQSLSGLLTRGWFHRVWIVQEAVFAQKLVFVCGPYKIFAQRMSNVSAMLALTGWSVQLMAHDTPDIVNQQMVPPGGYASVENMRERISGFNKPSPLDILVSTRSRQATKAVDSVFGVLNVLAATMGKDPKDLSVQPDYSKLLWDVMENTTLMIIRHEGDLRALHQIQEPSIRTISGCSSWTVNWRQRMAPEPLIMASQNGVPWTPAGRWSRKQRPDTSLPRKLKFRAAQIGSIVALSEDSEKMNGNSGDWLMFAADLGRKPYKMGIGQSCTEILWRSIIADIAGDQHPAPAYAGDAFVLSCLMMHVHRTSSMNPFRAGASDAVFCEKVKLLRKADPRSIFPSEDDIPGLLWGLRGNPRPSQQAAFIDFVTKCERGLEVLRPRIDKVMLNRRLARTQCNLLAVVPTSSRSGDGIWAIPGLQTPFVLRRCGASGFQFVGEAYVHGVMHGELSDSMTFEDIVLQ